MKLRRNHKGLSNKTYDLGRDLKDINGDNTLIMFVKLTKSLACKNYLTGKCSVRLPRLLTNRSQLLAQVRYTKVTCKDSNRGHIKMPDHHNLDKRCRSCEQSLQLFTKSCL